MCGRRPRCKRNLACGLRSGASHVSGLLLRHMTAGPDVIRGSGPDQDSRARCAHRPQSGFPDRRLDRFASRHHHPRNWNAPVDAISTSSSPSPFRPSPQAPALDRFSPLASTAQAMRAILLASATATTLAGRRANSCISQGCLSGWAARAASLPSRRRPAAGADIGRLAWRSSPAAPCRRSSSVAAPARSRPRTRAPI